MRILKVLTSILMFFLIMTGCSGTINVISTEEQPPTVVGEWLSSSVVNNDPFFEDLKFPGNIKFTFNENGTFEWIDYTIKGRNVNIETYSTGTYVIDSNNKLTAHDEKSNEDVVCDIIIESDKLTLTTDDGFIFEFDRVL